MRLTISKKLILAFLGLTLVVLVATLGLARWSFERGFMDYMNAVEQRRLEMLADTLADEYSDRGGNWTDLTERRFAELVRQIPLAPTVDGKPGPNRADRPPPPPWKKSGSPPARGRPGFGPKTSLYNADGLLIAGSSRFDSTSSRHEALVLIDGKTIGELVSSPERHFDSPQNTAFSRQQLTSSFSIGMAALVLASLVSWLLTNALLAPVNRMISGVSRLSNGQYETRFNQANTDEFGQLMGDLDKLALQLEENRSSRRRWLADISHELRTPITVLTGEIETLKDGIRPLGIEQIHSLDQEVARLRNLVDDLYQLSLSDIGGLRYSFSTINIRDSLESASKSLRQRAQAQGIEIRVSKGADAYISADAQRLDQLFLNLICNALSYTDSPGQIDIMLTQKNGKIRLCLEDTPPGVEAAECDRLFDPLYRQDASRSRHTAGAGLGLAICKNIVTAHQGTIEAFPSSLGGLCIDIQFPAVVQN